MSQSNTSDAQFVERIEYVYARVIKRLTARWPKMAHGTRPIPDSDIVDSLRRIPGTDNMVCDKHGEVCALYFVEVDGARVDVDVRAHNRCGNGIAVELLHTPLSAGGNMKEFLDGVHDSLLQMLSIVI
ncbi:hypothetical protein ACSRUE_17935 [Sorangium sp. KYC3313]|uniref:hypothetical protein n=1 Tax=Sorangium sp. KYC3313 TaxID=3449740 RepID=UPI003F89A703